MQNKFLTILIFFFSIWSFTFLFAKTENEVAPEIDLDKFSGLWLEMVRTPNFSQKKCDYSSLHYENVSKSEAEITNFCITFDNGKKRTKSHASLIGKNKSNRTFYVEYTGFMGLVKPFSNGNFHIFYVNDDYTITIIGHPDKSSFWILSRDILNDQELKNMVALAHSYGLNTEKLIFDDYSHEAKNTIIEAYK